MQNSERTFIGDAGALKLCEICFTTGKYKGM